MNLKPNQMTQLDNKFILLQKKVFSRWVSYILRKQRIIIKDVTTQLSNGVNLIILADNLTSKPITARWTRNPVKLYQKIENCQIAFDIFRKDGVTLANISPKDITDGNNKKILSLIWALIKKYAIEKFSGATQANKHSRLIIQSVFYWFAHKTSIADANINCFKKYYLSFAALISLYRPDVLDYQQESNNSNELIAQKVISSLNKLNIPLLFDSEDLLGEIDKRSLLTQIAYIKNTFDPNTYIKDSNYNLINDIMIEFDSDEFADSNQKSEFQPYSGPWDYVINDSPQEQEENTALFDDDSDNESNTGSSSSSFPPLYQHRRSNSCQIQTSYSYSQKPRLYNSQSFSAWLPKDIIDDMVDDDEPNLTIEGYDKYLENKQLDEASNLLQQLISQAKDQKEKSKLYRSAANANKRHFNNKEACKMYEEAEKADPESTQNYIDHAKLLDEIGQITEAEKTLQRGLEKTNIAESIITKLIKQFERRQKFDAVRNTLGKIYKDVGFQRSTAPSFAEGALFESRHGNVFSAIFAFEEICKIIPAKTGYYVELAENIKRRGFEQQALQIAQNGVQKFPAMPNNWCQLIQLQKSTQNIINTFQSAEKLISPLMMSKLEQSAAVMCASFGDLRRARMILAECIFKVANDQRWRILYNAAMVELLYGDNSLTILLLPSAAQYTPDKFAPTVILAMAKVYEINGDLEQAMSNYETLTRNYSNDWRIFLEKAMFLVRLSRYKDALECTKKGLEMYPNTGRLWALRVQLEDHDSKIKVLLDAIMSSPKSGEIWTEAARIVMNPLSPYFNLKSAKFFLNTAYLFTPQYIDLFIEMIRLEILLNGYMANLDKIREIFLGGDGNYGTVIFQFRKLGKEFTSYEFEAIQRGVQKDIAKNHKLYQHAISRSDFVIESLRTEENKLKSDQRNHNPFMFAFGLSSFLEAMTNTADIGTYKSVILGSSSVFM